MQNNNNLIGQTFNIFCCYKFWLLIDWLPDENNNEQVNVDYITHLAAAKCTYRYVYFVYWIVCALINVIQRIRCALQLKMIRVEYSLQPLVKLIKPSVTRT